MTNPHQVYLFAHCMKLSLFSLSLIGITKEHTGDIVCIIGALAQAGPPVIGSQ